MGGLRINLEEAPTDPISDIAMTATLRASETKDYPFLP